MCLELFSKGKSGQLAFVGANTGDYLTVGPLDINSPRSESLLVKYFDAITHFHSNLQYGDETGLHGVKPASLLAVAASCVLGNAAILNQWLQTLINGLQPGGLLVITEVLDGRSHRMLNKLALPLLRQYQDMDVVRDLSIERQEQDRTLVIQAIRGPHSGPVELLGLECLVKELYIPFAGKDKVSEEMPCSDGVSCSLGVGVGVGLSTSIPACLIRARILWLLPCMDRTT